MSYLDIGQGFLCIGVLGQQICALFLLVLFSPRRVLLTMEYACFKNRKIFHALVHGAQDLVALVMKLS